MNQTNIFDYLEFIAGTLIQFARLILVVVHVIQVIANLFVNV